MQTIPRQEWWLKNQPIKIDPRTYHKKTIASIAAISNEKGAELIMNFEKSVNREMFIAFLKKLRQNDPFRPMALFLDRLAVHRSNQVKEAADKLKIILILNASYSPNLNPVEGAIGLAKAQIKMKRWNSLQNGIDIELNEVIEKSIMEIEEKKIKNFVKKSN